MKYEKIEDWSEVEWSQEVEARSQGKSGVKSRSEVKARMKSSQEVKKWRMNEKGKNE